MRNFLSNSILYFTALFLFKASWYSTLSGQPQRLATWDVFDKIYCITGNWSTGRRRKVVEQFKRVGLDEYVTFYYGRLDKNNGHRGAWMAHQAVALEAKAENLERVLVFEDDIKFTDNFVSFYKQRLYLANLFFDLNQHWEFFLLGHNPFATQATGYKHIVKTRSWGMMAYVMSKPGIQKIASAVYPRAYGETIDGLVYKSTGAYAFFPMVVKHTPNLSYTTKRNRTQLLNIMWQRKEKLLYDAASTYLLCFPSFAAFNQEDNQGNEEDHKIECDRF
jgi:GR25 family glycosyltransferase involved in LPS biosynthesis